MKQLKIVLLFAVILGYLPKPNAQTFFADSMVWHTDFFQPGLSGPPYNFYFKESIHYDSTGQNGEYYTIKRIKENYYANQYQFRTKDRRVYFTGFILVNGDSVLTNDLVIYDFNLTQGDTLKVFLKPDKRLYQLVVDSIRSRTFDDGMVRVTQYYSGIIDNAHLDWGKFFIVEGLGSNQGLIPFQLEQSKAKGPDVFQTTISICKGQTPIYRHLDYFNDWLRGNFCDEDSIRYFYRKLSIRNSENEQIAFYPNPTNNSLHFSGLEQGSFEIYNTHGSLMQSGIVEKEVSVSDLVPGFYYLLLRNETGVYSGKFVKE